MKRDRVPFMPIAVDDFEAGTAHLTLEEDGVYNRVLRLCWRTPGCCLPDERAWLIRMLRVDEATYDRVVEPIINEFFTREDGHIVQKRLRKEFEYVLDQKNRRSSGGKKGADARWQKTQDNHDVHANDVGTANAEAMPRHSEANRSTSGSVVAPHPTPLGSKIPPPSSTTRAHAREGGGGGFNDTFGNLDRDFHEQVLAAARIDVAKDASGKWYAQRWITQRWVTELNLTEAEALMVVRDVVGTYTDGPPSTLSYFDRAMQRAAGRKTASPLKPIVPERRDMPTSVFGDGPEYE